MPVTCVCGREAGPGDVECSLCGRPLLGEARPDPEVARPPTSAARPTGPRWPLVALAVLVVVVLFGGVVLLIRPAATARSAPTVTGNAATGPGASSDTLPVEEPGSSAAAEPSEDTVSPPSEDDVVLPFGAVECPSLFSDASDRLLHSARGNDVTTCPFAENVRKAYLGAGAGGDQVVRAHSPVTGKNYRMTCSGAAPVVCEGGKDAVVLLW